MTYEIYFSIVRYMKQKTDGIQMMKKHFNIQS